VLRCFFCNKSQFEIEKMVVGQLAIICDECVRVCADIIAEDPPSQALSRGARITAWPDEVHCSVCRNEVPDEDVVPVEGCGFICTSCAAKIRKGIANTKRRPRGRTTRA
jgi:Zn finger protein HypA/HybF involved in hydrogenase expression